jgi:streptogramin lyase
MAEKPAVRIFISSPADVRPERLLAERVIARLDREFAYHFHVEAELWEREPLVATYHFQDPRNIPVPSSADIVVVILWSRLGVRLPEDQFRGKISGRPVTGTEWEFEEALAAARERDGVPHLMLYRKCQPVTATLDDDALLDQMRLQKHLVEEFMGRWFGSVANNDVTAASRTFTTTQEFEDLIYEHLRALLERRAGEFGDSAAIRWHEAPFRGLLSFEIEQAPVFFGRTRARNELRELLARQVTTGKVFVLVLGASGSGKSSLVKAGLLPDLSLPGMIGRVALCRYAVMRPSDAPSDLIDGLAVALLASTALPELAGLGYTADRLAALLREAPAQVAVPIEQALIQAGKAAGLAEIAQARLVLVCDQLEELFTIESLNNAQGRQFVTALDALAASGLVWIVATMRSDFFDRIEDFPELAHLAVPDARYLLLPPTANELGQIIRQPAREAGVRYDIDSVDGSTLDEVIREEAAKDRSVLPLLSFLLDQLWRRRDERGVLTFAAYRELGGLEGSLATHASEIFDGQPQRVRSALPRVLRALVSIGPDDMHVAARAVPLSRFPLGSPDRQLVEAFLSPDARLLVASADESLREPVVRVAHEALLTHWDLARRQIAEDRTDLQIQSRLEDAAARWSKASADDRDSLLLRSGLPLSEAADLVKRRGDELDAEARRFVAAGVAASDRDSHVTKARSAVIFGISALLAAWQLLVAFAMLSLQRDEAVPVIFGASGQLVAIFGDVAIAVQLLAAIGLLLRRTPRLSSALLLAALVLQAVLLIEGWGLFVGRGLPEEGAIFVRLLSISFVLELTVVTFVVTLRNWREELKMVVRPQPTAYVHQGLIAVALVVLALGGYAIHAAWAFRFQEYSLPKGSDPDAGIVSGPDSALWFTENGTDKIGRITTGGKITQPVDLDLPRGSAPSGPFGIAVGSDGALWVTAGGTDEIDRIPMHGTIKRWPAPPKSGRCGRTGGPGPYGITAGPDGELWFTEQSADAIVRITTLGKIAPVYQLPCDSNPQGIASGPDGNIWFTETGIDEIGRITMRGEFTLFPLHGKNAAPAAGDSPMDIASGPDGALWFTEFDGNKIGRITTSGTITDYPLPSSSGPVGITVGRDGALWFTERHAGKIGRITTRGEITQYPLPGGSHPDRIASGPDGAIWFTVNDKAKIGRL